MAITIDLKMDAEHRNLQPEGARKVMEQRLSEHVEEGEPVTLEDVLSSGTLAIPFLRSSQAEDADWLAARLRKARRNNLMRVLGAILSELKSGNPDHGDLREKTLKTFVQALKKISSDSPLDQLRVKHLLKSLGEPPDVDGNEESGT